MEIWKFIANSDFKGLYLPNKEEEAIFDKLEKNYIKQNKSLFDEWEPLLLMSRGGIFHEYSRSIYYFL